MRTSTKKHPNRQDGHTSHNLTRNVSPTSRQIQDNRPEAIAQRKLIAIAGSSSQSGRFQAAQEMADAGIRNPFATSLPTVQKGADTSAAKGLEGHAAPVQRTLAIKDPDGTEYTEIGEPGFVSEAHGAIVEHQSAIEARDYMDFPGVYGNYLENSGVFRHYLARLQSNSIDYGVFDLSKVDQVIRLYFLLRKEVLTDVGDTEVESPRLERIRKSIGGHPTHDAIFDAFVATLKADGFKYIPSSPGGTDVLEGSNAGACASIRIALGRAFKQIMGEDQAKENKYIQDIYVPIDADYIDPSCPGNVENDRAYFFVQHYYLHGYDPTSGKRGALSYVRGTDSNFYDWVKGFDLTLQTSNRARFQELAEMVGSVRKFETFFLLTIGKKYYKVRHTQQDINALP